MVDEKHLMRMFTAVHGEMTGSCYAEVYCDGMGDPCGVNVMKDGHLCWSVTVGVLTFEYITKDWE